MNYNQFYNLSCYEEFEIQCALMGISKVDVLKILKRIGYKVDNYYFFISEDGIFNWYDLKGNHIENPGVLKELKEEYIPASIYKCIIPDSVTSIDSYAFYSCIHLKKVDIPDSVICIDNYVFRGCKSLETITIPDSVTSIGDRAFAHCTSLKEITIPDSVTSIGDRAFLFCESLNEVIFKGKTLKQIKQMENYPFGIEDKSVFKFS